MNIQEYIKTVHKGNDLWFLDEVNNPTSAKRVQYTLDKKKYLDGSHAVLNRQVENYNGTPYVPRAVVLQYAKLIMQLETTYLLKHPLTIVGDESIVTDMKRVYKRGKYDKINMDILANLVKYGNAYEYVYVNEKGIVTSKVIDSASGFPIYDDEMNMVAFIEYYTALESDYYVVYTVDAVTKYVVVGEGKKDVEVVGAYKNVSGLPIHYKTNNEMDKLFGKSDLDDFVNIIDSMEDLLSKFSDSFYKHHNPIPVVIGQPLKGEGLNPHIVGGGITLDDGADFKMVSNEINHDAFDTIYSVLKQEMINIASLPAVALNSSDVSNLSEMSMRMLYQLADMKAGINESYLREGLEARHEIILDMMSKTGKEYDEDTLDTLDVKFTYARPVVETEVIDNIVKMFEAGAMSIESLVEMSPYISNEHVELKRILEANAKVQAKSVTENNAETGIDEDEDE